MADTAATPSIHVPSTLEQRKYDEAVEAGAVPAEATELSRATPAPGSTWHEPQGEAPDMEAAASRADTAARVVGVEPEPEPTTSVAVRAPRTLTRTRTTAAAATKARPSTKASAPSAGAKKATSKKR